MILKCDGTVEYWKSVIVIIKWDVIVININKLVILVRRKRKTLSRKGV